jgi:hypothetical protein
MFCYQVKIAKMTNKNKLGTIEQATINAKKWLENIHEEGFKEVEMQYVEYIEDMGVFLFHFTHRVTGKIATLYTQGLTDDERWAFIFKPKVYCNGSSTADPKVEDWLTDEYSYSRKITYFKLK